LRALVKAELQANDNGRNGAESALCPLAALAAGAAATVADVRVPPEHRGRLLELGLIAGTPVEVVRFAPLGDPVEVRVRGYHLSLRRHEAEQIWVRPG
jgi:ferrous iron transport protein A